MAIQLNSQFDPSQALNQQEQHNTAMSQMQIEQANQLAQALLKEGMSGAPTYSPWGAAGRIAESLAGAIKQRNAAQGDIAQSTLGASYMTPPEDSGANDAGSPEDTGTPDANAKMVGDAQPIALHTSGNSSDYWNNRPNLSSVAKAWTNGGMSSNGVAGVLGNLRQETSLKGGDINPNEITYNDAPKQSGEARNAHGFYQENGDEWRRYNAWLQKNDNGNGWKDPNNQNNFAVWNLKTNYPKVWSALQNAQSPEQAAHIYERGYLRPAPAAANAKGRQAWAREAFTNWGGLGNVSAANANNPLQGPVNHPVSNDGGNVPVPVPRPDDGTAVPGNALPLQAPQQQVAQNAPVQPVAGPPTNGAAPNTNAAAYPNGYGPPLVDPRVLPRMPNVSPAQLRQMYIYGNPQQRQQAQELYQKMLQPGVYELPDGSGMIYYNQQNPSQQRFMPKGAMGNVYGQPSLQTFSGPGKPTYTPAMPNIPGSNGAPAGPAQPSPSGPPPGAAGPPQGGPAAAPAAPVLTPQALQAAGQRMTPPTPPAPSASPAGQVQNRFGVMQPPSNTPGAPQPIRVPQQPQVKDVSQLGEVGSPERSQAIHSYVPGQSAFPLPPGMPGSPYQGATAGPLYQRDTEAYKGSAGKYEKDYDRIDSDGEQATNGIKYSQMILQFLHSPDFQPGSGAEQLGHLDAWAQRVGLSQGDKAALNETFHKMVGAVGTRMASVPYASEVHLATAQLPDTEKQRGASIFAADSIMRQQMQTADKREMAQQYVAQHGRLDRGFDQAWNRYQRDHPLYGPGAIQNVVRDVATSNQQPAAPQQAQPNQMPPPSNVRRYNPTTRSFE